jgi:hypothetical protein
MTDEELGRKIWAHDGNDLNKPHPTHAQWFASLGAAARALLTKPPATREAVAKWHYETYAMKSGTWTEMDSILAAIQHFAAPDRPKTRIEGMTETEIAQYIASAHRPMDMIGCTYPPETRESFANHAARVAHRLANTPAPVVDEDAEAKRLHALAKRAAVAEGWPGEVNEWCDLHEGVRAGWRAVAREKAGE